MVEHPEQAWNKQQPCNDSRGDKLMNPNSPTNINMIANFHMTSQSRMTTHDEMITHITACNMTVGQNTLLEPIKVRSSPLVATCAVTYSLKILLSSILSSGLPPENFKS